MKYQIVVQRSLKGFGQFVTESRDEVNTYLFGEDDERPIIFGSKLRAVERRKIMAEVRSALNVNCHLKTHKKRGDSGISGLCLSCPACFLFGGTYAPKISGTAEEKNVVQPSLVTYDAAYPFVGGGIRDVTFNAVDEETHQTGQALGTNQIAEPRDFIDVVDMDTDNEDWVKLLVWSIERSDRYGANVRIYGKFQNSILGVLKSDRLKLSAIDLAKLDGIEAVKDCLKKDYGNSFLQINYVASNPENIGDSKTETGSNKNTNNLTVPENVTQLIRTLASNESVEELARRKNRVDLFDYETVAKAVFNFNEREFTKNGTDTALSQKDIYSRVEHVIKENTKEKKEEKEKRLKEILSDKNEKTLIDELKKIKKADQLRAIFVGLSEYQLARLLESAKGKEEEGEE